ncbi:hypothetical protein [Haladaptatus sp. NG-WS-4]
MRSQSKLLQLVGGVGYTVFDWRFDSTENPVVTGIAIVCVVVAVVATVLRAR